MWRWQGKWVSSFYRGETDPGQDRGEGAGLGGVRSPNVDPTRPHSEWGTVSGAPLPVLSPGGPRGSLLTSPSSRMGERWGRGRVWRGTPGPLLLAPRAARALGAQRWRKPRSRPVSRVAPPHSAPWTAPPRGLTLASLGWPLLIKLHFC